MGNLAKAVTGGAALYGADALTGHQVGANLASGITTLGQNIAGQATNILSGTAANTNAAPLLGSASGLAMGATGVYSAYRGISKTKEHGIVRGVQEGSLAFGTITGIGAMTGRMGTSALTSPLLAAGLGIYGARKTWELGSTFMEKPGENLVYGATQPFKWTGGAIKSLVKGKGGKGTTP